MPSQICSIPECFIALCTRVWLVPSVSAPISSTAEWVFTQLSTILLSFTLSEHLSLKLFACDDVKPHWLLLFWLFSTVCLQMLFQIARLRAYIFTLITFCLNILHCVFSSSNDLRINYHIGCICQTFLTWENFCTTSALSPEMRPLPSVSFHVHLQVVSTRKRFST